MNGSSSLSFKLVVVGQSSPSRLSFSIERSQYNEGELSLSGTAGRKITQIYFYFLFPILFLYHDSFPRGLEAVYIKL
jgi:hypothetical protein